jgi:hypothetical protein
LDIKVYLNPISLPQHKSTKVAKTDLEIDPPSKKIVWPVTDFFSLTFAYAQCLMIHYFGYQVITAT